MKRGYLFTGIAQDEIRESLTHWDDAKWKIENGIFISHKKEDRDKAIEIGREIASRTQIPCYVDELDPNIKGDSPDLVTYIQEVIHRSKSMLAVVSKRTVNSWWVPLEIGVALENKKYISSYRIGAIDLPSYLWLWPTLTTNEEAVEWAKVTQRGLDAGQLHQAWQRKNSHFFFNSVDFFRDCQVRF